MTGWLTSRENACRFRVTEGTGPGRQNSFQHHCGSIWRVSQKERDVGVIDRSKKVPGGWKSTDGPSVMSCLLWVSPGLQRASWRALGQVVQVTVGTHGHRCIYITQVHRYKALLRWLLSPGPSFYENSLVWGSQTHLWTREGAILRAGRNCFFRRAERMSGKRTEKETCTLRIRSKRLA